MTMLVTIETKIERYDFFNQTVLDRVVSTSIDQGRATHVVVGIKWGATAYITLEQNNVEKKKKNEIEGKMKAAVKVSSVTQFIISLLTGMYI